jgi:hypothetical protein
MGWSLCLGGERPHHVAYADNALIQQVTNRRSKHAGDGDDRRDRYSAWPAPEWTVKVMDEGQQTVVNVIFATGFVRGPSKTVPARDARALRRILELTLSAGWPALRGVLRCNKEMFLDENGY